MKRYYSTQRPLAQGTFPKKDGRETIVNFMSNQGKVYCEEVDCYAWGYIEYPEPLSKKEADDYELVEGGSFGSVVEGLYQDGTAVAIIVDDRRN